MKVTIIDVVKEVKDFYKPRKILQRVEHRYKPTQILDDNADPNDMPDEQGTLKTYELEEICDSVNGNRSYYVQKDDNEIFNDLLLINTQNINDKIDEKVKELNCKVTLRGKYMPDSGYEVNNHVITFLTSRRKQGKHYPEKYIVKI